jgi:hypothetical protein
MVQLVFPQTTYHRMQSTRPAREGAQMCAWWQCQYVHRRPAHYIIIPFTLPPPTEHFPVQHHQPSKSSAGGGIAVEQMATYPHHFILCPNRFHHTPATTRLYDQIQSKCHSFCTTRQYHPHHYPTPHHTTGYHHVDRSVDCRTLPCPPSSPQP